VAAEVSMVFVHSFISQIYIASLLLRDAKRYSCMLSRLHVNGYQVRGNSETQENQRISTLVTITSTWEKQSPLTSI